MWKRAAVLGLCVMAGCLEPVLVLCAGGFACPASARCDDVHLTCVLPEQLVVCGDASPGADCETGPVTGGCFDGVCLPRGCSNRVVEPGELCDDGNQISGDGCSSTCKSTERCGNGFVDPGEPCDDGNLRSRDGCDSRCLVEDAAWSSVIAIAPGYFDARNSAYDAARGRLVYAGWQSTWEWDRRRWRFVPDTFALGENPRRDQQVVYYDPDRQRVCLIGNDSFNGVHAYAWIDDVWQRIDTEPEGPSVDPSNYARRVAAVYDVQHHRLITIEAEFNGMSRVWALDAAGAWSELPSLPGFVEESIAAYDAAADQVVVVSPQGAEWVFDGTEWTSSQTGFAGLVSLTFDPLRGHLVLWDSYSGLLYERIDAAWQEISDAPAPCNAGAYSPLPLYPVPDSAALELVAADGSQICRWDGAWTLSAPQLPFRPIGVTYDPHTGAFVVLSNSHPRYKPPDGAELDADAVTEMWALTDGDWHRISTTPGPSGQLFGGLVVYSAGRAATVLYGQRPSSREPGCEDAETWSFSGSTWTQITAAPAFCPSYGGAMTYDPKQGRVLRLDFDAVWGLDDTADEWVRVGDAAPIDTLAGAGWNARSGNLLALGLFNGATPPLFELAGAAWTPIRVAPAFLYAARGGNTLGTDERTGNVSVIDRVTGTAWEYTGTEWLELPPVPVKDTEQSWIAIHPIDGSMLFVGQTTDGFLATILKRTSATPFESCRAGEDLDGDGLAGCDDHDCYATCAACLPYTSCR